jgi:hypothetical protein
MATTPEGAPKPWNHPFSDQSRTESASVVENPIPMLRRAETSTPRAKKKRRFAWSARKPLTSFPNA